MEKEPITVSGLKSLKSELENLKNVQRPKIVAAIAEARSHGDLKENAEYHAAKEQQSLIESRVITINDLIELLKIKEPNFSKFKSYAIAVNLNYENSDYMLKENDEVAIIPPVSGG